MAERKETTPSFVTEIPLKVGSHEASILGKRFWAAKQQYNALLGEALSRLDAMRRNPEYARARELYQKGESKSEARELFRSLEEKHGFRKYDLFSYTKQWNKKGGGLRVGARISQCIAARAFLAVENYQKGVRGRPRFKGYRGLSSIEDNSIDANLRLKGEEVHYLGLRLPLLYNPQDPIHCHGRMSPVKYIRLVRRHFNGRIRYFAQLICEGTPWVKSKNVAREGVVGLDIGPQTIAVVAPETLEASLHVFADELKTLKTEKKKLQRKLARQLRAANPDSFEADRWEKKDKHWKCKKGKNIKGKSLRNRSRSLHTTSSKLSDLSRREAAFRKAQHGRLANNILKQGTTIKTEKLSYKAFQKLFGSSVGLRAPGMFLALLRRKAENAGGRVEEINTWQTALSQTCHCSRREKKPLHERWHRCPCGVVAQRDLYSAYLACFVEDNKLIADQARNAWSGMDIALRTAMSCIKHSSSGLLPASLGLKGLGAEGVVRAVS